MSLTRLNALRVVNLIIMDIVNIADGIKTNKMIVEYAIHALNWLVIAFSLYWAAKLLTRPEIERKHVVRNSIQMHVESEKHLNSSDRIVLMKKATRSINS